MIDIDGLFHKSQTILYIQIGKHFFFLLVHQKAVDFVENKIPLKDKKVKKIF